MPTKQRRADSCNPVPTGCLGHSESDLRKPRGIMGQLVLSSAGLWVSVGAMADGDKALDQ